MLAPTQTYSKTIQKIKNFFFFLMRYAFLSILNHAMEKNLGHLILVEDTFTIESVFVYDYHMQ